MSPSNVVLCVFYSNSLFGSLRHFFYIILTIHITNPPFSFWFEIWLDMFFLIFYLGWVDMFLMVFVRFTHWSNQLITCRYQSLQKEWIQVQSELLAQSSVLRAEMSAAQLERTKLEGDLNTLKEQNQQMDLNYVRLSSQYQVWKHLNIFSQHRKINRVGSKILRLGFFQFKYEPLFVSLKNVFLLFKNI